MTTMRDDRGDSLPPRAMPTTADTSRTTTGAIVAGSLLFVVGAFNVIHGLTLLDSPDILESTYLYDNLDFWGWSFLIWGVLQAAAGIAATMARGWGVMLGTALASVAMVLWFFMIFAAPGAAIVAILLNVAVIYGLSSVERA